MHTDSIQAEATPRRLMAFFAALCLFLATLEYAVPKPLPFLRLGLANMPILLSLEKMRRRGTVLLVALKVLLQALVSGTLFSYVLLFSLAGSAASAAVMLALHVLFARRGFVSAVGLSVAGAMANAVAQLVLARFLLFGAGARYVAPLVLASACASGTALGVFCALFMRKSAWYAQLPSCAKAPACGTAAAGAGGA